MKKLCQKKSLTTLEVIIVVLIVAILSTLVFPNLGKTIKKSRAKLAVSNLRLIVNAEKLYRARCDSYLACDDLDAINTDLNLDIEDKYFDYNIETSGNYDFTAYATSKKDSSVEYSINPEGNISYP